MISSSRRSVSVLARWASISVAACSRNCDRLRNFAWCRSMRRSTSLDSVIDVLTFILPDYYPPPTCVKIESARVAERRCRDQQVPETIPDIQVVFQGLCDGAPEKRNGKPLTAEILMTGFCRKRIINTISRSSVRGPLGGPGDNSGLLRCRRRPAGPRRLPG